VLVKRVPALDEAEAADLLGLARKTLQNHRTRGTGPVYSRMANGRIRYRETDLMQWRDGDRRISTTEPAAATT